MALREEMERSGQALFRWRSYMPVPPLLVVAGAAALSRQAQWSTVAERTWAVFCILVCAAGLTVRAHVVGTTPAGTSGRNTRAQKAEHLNVTGWYSVVRHPLYLGNALMWLGIALLPRNAWAVVVCGFYFWVCYERIMLAEEAFLRERFGVSFLQWAERTPALFPALSRWRAAELPFSLRTVLRREYSGMFGAAAAFGLIDLAREHAARGEWTVDPLWKVTLALCAAGSLALKLMKSRTRWLSVAGRS
jgi:protein-S-isoprenylcysteine O-methyltransferase Ste14